MKYQLLALDLDGTLTNSKKEISKPTLDALLALQERGVTLILASGRPTIGVLPLAKQLKMDVYGGYVLAFNGGRIVDCKTNEILYNQLLDSRQIAAPLMEILKPFPQVDLITYFEDAILSLHQPNAYTQIESKINHIPILTAKDFLAELPSDRVNKFLITGAPNTVLPEIKDRVISHFGPIVSSYFSCPFFLEVVPPVVDKANSLKFLLDRLALDREQLVCCGDGENDLSMIKLAGLGIAMKNGEPQVLADADYITKSNDEDGILHVIQTFF